MYRKVIGILILAVSILAFTGCRSQENNHSTWNEDVQYLVHFGLNDKDTGEQILSLEEAQQAIQDICVEKGVGFTVYSAYGAYVENGIPQANDTLVFSLVLVTEDTVNEIANEAMETLNLASVFIIKDSVDYVIYGAGEIPASTLKNQEGK